MKHISLFIQQIKQVKSHIKSQKEGCFQKIIYLWRNNTHQTERHIEQKRYLCIVLVGKTGQTYRKRFCFILRPKSPISSKKGWRQYDAHSVCICIGYSLCCILLHSIRRGYCFFTFISYGAFGDAWSWWMRTSPHAFLLFIFSLTSEDLWNSSHCWGFNKLGI